MDFQSGRLIVACTSAGLAYSLQTFALSSLSPSVHMHPGYKTRLPGNGSSGKFKMESAKCWKFDKSIFQLE